MNSDISARLPGETSSPRFVCPGNLAPAEILGVSVSYIPYKDLCESSRGAFGEYRFALYKGNASLHVRKGVNNPSIGGWGKAEAIIDLRTCMSRQMVSDMQICLSVVELIMNKLDRGVAPALIIASLQE